MPGRSMTEGNRGRRLIALALLTAFACASPEAALAAPVVVTSSPAPMASPSPGSALPSAADSAHSVSLTPDETRAMELGLIAAKPSLSTVTLASFVFPGSQQAYMGHVDHTLGMWGGYLLVFFGAKAFWADTDLTAGQRTSDVVIAGAFMVMATLSALDAFLLASQERDGYDRLINRLADKERPEIKYIESVPKQ